MVRGEVGGAVGPALLEVLPTVRLKGGSACGSSGSTALKVVYCAPLHRWGTLLSGTNTCRRKKGGKGGGRQVQA